MDEGSTHVRTLEKQIRQLLKTRSGLDRSVVELRAQLRNAYKAILLGDVEHAAAKEVEQNLWKSVFYRPIEEHRRRLVRATPDNSTRYVVEFQDFLIDASQFFHEILRELHVRCNLPTNADLQDVCSWMRGLRRRDRGLLMIHRLHIFLGDIARYRMQLKGRGQGLDWFKVSERYMEAIQIDPQNGNGHNQLAVIATYFDDNFTATYRYFRSLGAPVPFLKARENLQLLFEKNRVKFMAMKKDPAHPLMEAFCTRFVRLHGILFTRTSMETFEDVRRETLRNFSALLKEKLVGRVFLTRILAVCIFSVHNASTGDPEAAQTETEVANRPVYVGHSFAFLAELVTSVLMTATQCEEPDMDMLAPLGSFSMWMRTHPEYWAAGDVVTRDASARKALWEALSDFLNTHPPSHTSPESVYLPMREDIELFGFLPLRTAHRELSIEPALMNPSVKRNVLLRRIREVGKAVVNAKVSLLFVDPSTAQFTATAVPDTEGMTSSPPLQAPSSEFEDEVILFAPEDVVVGSSGSGSSSPQKSPRPVIGKIPSGDRDPPGSLPGPYVRIHEQGLRNLNLANGDDQSMFSTNLFATYKPFQQGTTQGATNGGGVGNGNGNGNGTAGNSSGLLDDEDRVEEVSFLSTDHYYSAAAQYWGAPLGSSQDIPNGLGLGLGALSSTVATMPAMDSGPSPYPELFAENDEEIPLWADEPVPTEPYDLQQQGDAPPTNHPTATRSFVP